MKRLIQGEDILPNTRRQYYTQAMRLLDTPRR